MYYWKHLLSSTRKNMERKPFIDGRYIINEAYKLKMSKKWKYLQNVVMYQLRSHIKTI